MRMRTGLSRPVIFVVISALVVALIYSSSVPFDEFVLGVQREVQGETCNIDESLPDVDTLCCRFDEDEKQVCVRCSFYQGELICDDDESGMKKNPDANVPPGGGVLEPGKKQPVNPEANVPQDSGVFEQPPTSPPRNDANVPQDSGVLQQPLTSPQQGQKNALEDEASRGSVLQQPLTSPQQGQKNALEDEASKGSVFEQRSMYNPPQIAPPTTNVDQENKTPSN